jgi:hypothetical protein
MFAYVGFLLFFHLQRARLEKISARFLLRLGKILDENTRGKCSFLAYTFKPVLIECTQISLELCS